MLKMSSLPSIGTLSCALSPWPSSYIFQLEVAGSSTEVLPWALSPGNGWRGWFILKGVSLPKKICHHITVTSLPEKSGSSCNAIMVRGTFTLEPSTCLGTWEPTPSLVYLSKSSPEKMLVAHTCAHAHTPTHTHSHTLGYSDYCFFASS